MVQQNNTFIKDVQVLASVASGAMGTMFIICRKYKWDHKKFGEYFDKLKLDEERTKNIRNSDEYKKLLKKWQNSIL